MTELELADFLDDDRRCRPSQFPASTQGLLRGQARGAGCTLQLALKLDAEGEVAEARWEAEAGRTTAALFALLCEAIVGVAIPERLFDAVKVAAFVGADAVGMEAARTFGVACRAAFNSRPGATPIAEPVQGGFLLGGAALWLRPRGSPWEARPKEPNAEFTHLVDARHFARAAEGFAASRQVGAWGALGASYARALLVHEATQLGWCSWPVEQSNAGMQWWSDLLARRLGSEDAAIDAVSAGFAGLELPMPWAFGHIAGEQLTALVADETSDDEAMDDADLALRGDLDGGWAALRARDDLAAHALVVLPTWVFVAKLSDRQPRLRIELPAELLPAGHLAMARLAER